MTYDLTANSSPTVRNPPCGGTLANGGQTSRASMSGMFSSGRTDTRHMAEHTGPYALSDPECEGLVRLYPSSRPRPPMGMQKPYPWMENMHPITSESTCPAEQGCYPFSVVKRLPDVIPGNEESHKQRMEMERKALYELLKSPNPDEYPWRGAPEFIDPYCRNNDPEKGPMNCDVWYSYCMRQTLLRNSEEYDCLNYFCYVCKKTDSVKTRPPKGPRALSRCLICYDVWMCREHSIKLACLDSPMGIC
eukprot:169187-Amphidinium_carterae.1